MGQRITDAADVEEFGGWQLTGLAERCERGAAELLREAANAAGELATRANGHLITPLEWAAQKRSAVAAAGTYAEHLRAEAAELGETGCTTRERVEEADWVASAAECGGILIDSARLDESALQDPWNDENTRRMIRDHAAAKRAAVESSGLFEHVVQDGQVPFWRLDPAAA